MTFCVYEWCQPYIRIEKCYFAVIMKNDINIKRKPSIITQNTDLQKVRVKV